jgi:hypothetical protein
LLSRSLPALATGALSLFLMNLMYVNLAGVATFLVQGICPATWWEKDRAVSYAHRHRPVGGLLAALIGLILLLRKI